MLPIEEVLPRLLESLRSDASAVLQAPPGAGKTTRVPLALLHEPWLGDLRIVMLEPRRLAARAAASYMARLLGEDVGETVGYRVRFDTKITQRTRIEVVTEGVLTRMLQADPALEEYSIVIFDEFHERSIHADVGLALTLQARILRPELRVLVMSATLQSQAVAQLLGDAPVITSEGRSHPVETVYLERPHAGFVEPLVARHVRMALDEHAGDVLVFLPGAAEIRRTQEQLSDVVDATTSVLPLFGNLTQAEQDRAIAPSQNGKRKVVLATSIAETSLTIEGVKVVVDSGLMRVPRFDVRTGMTRLDTIKVTKASADQRRGRAGRLGPGVCYRLWTRPEHDALKPHNTPEILQADLTPLVLELAAWGVSNAADLAWLDEPPTTAYVQALTLLHELGAVDKNGAITKHGLRMVFLPTHPRIAHMLLRARDLNAVALACDVAALLAERDILRGQQNDPDLTLRLDALSGRRVNDVDHGALQRVKREADHLRRALHVPHAGVTYDLAGVLLAFAYPDRIGQRRDRRGSFVLRSGRGAVVDPKFTLAGEPYLVAAELDGRSPESRVFLAAAISEAEIREHFAEQIDHYRHVTFDDGRARAFMQERMGALVFKETRVEKPDPEKLAYDLMVYVLTQGLDVLPWTESARSLQQRVNFMRMIEPQWPDLSDAMLHQTLDTWLRPMLVGLDAVREIDVLAALQTLLPWNLRKQLDDVAPTHLQVPSGSQIRIDYSDPSAPSVAVRLQEVFGMMETPRIGGNRVPVTMHLLSPAQRPVQVTRDLASFWRSGYFDVKKELKGRYPKHYWPDDPLTAQATRRTKPRM